MVQLLLPLKSLTVLHANFTEFLELVCTTRSFRSFEFTRLKETFLVDGTRKIAQIYFTKLVFRRKSISSIYYHQSVGRWVDVSNWQIFDACEIVSPVRYGWKNITAYIKKQATLVTRKHKLILDFSKRIGCE